MKSKMLTDFRLFLITGIYQENTSPVENDTISHSEQALSLLKSTFHGVIIEANRNSVGNLNDLYGVSILKDIKINKNVFEFVKCYQNRNDTILYKFQKQSDLDWNGHYYGNFVGHGFARCKLIPVDFSYFSRESTLKSLTKIRIS